MSQINELGAGSPGQPVFSDTIGGNVANGTAVMARYSTSGDPVALSVGGSLFKLRGVPATLVPFGDSLVANGFNLAGQARNYMARGHFHFWNQLMGAPFRILNNGGVGGEVSSQWLTRLQADVLAYNPNYCFVTFPVNDARGGLDATTITIPNLLSIVTQLRAAGIIPIMATGGDSSQIVASTGWVNRDAVNSWLRSYCSANGILLMDLYSRTSDPATGTFATNMNYDVTHYSCFGAMAAAIGMKDASVAVAPTGTLSFGPIIRPSPRSPFTALQNAGVNGNNATGTNRFVQGALVTGNGPDAYSTLLGGSIASAVTSKVARTDGVQGEWARITATGVAAGDYMAFRPTDGIYLTRAWSFTTTKLLGERYLGRDGNQYVVTTAGTSTGNEPAWNTSIGAVTTDSGGVVFKRVENIKAGDTIEVFCEFAVTGVSGGTLGTLPILQASVGGVSSPDANDIRVNNYTSPDVLPVWPVATACGIRSAPFVLGAGASSVTVTLVGLRLAVGVTANFDLGLVDIRKVS